MGDTCCSGAGSCTCERGHAVASLTTSLSIYQGLVNRLRVEQLDDAALVAELRAQVSTLELKAKSDAAELGRIRSECETLRVGWAEFERVGLAQEQVISRLRWWARAWKAAAKRDATP